MSSEAPSARELTRRLVALAAPTSGAPDSVALAAYAACERTYQELTRSVGVAGAHALLLRAIALTSAEHPFLRAIRIDRHAEPGLDGVPDAVRTYGAPAVARGLEAALETLLELLGRLIGDDMVARLVEQSAPTKTQDHEDVT